MWLAALGITPPVQTTVRLTRPCMDLSGRKDQLAGSLAKALFGALPAQELVAGEY